ncbi:prephenate dehydratase [Kangiella shandongensis]|uniref:prephenate dehydratase n=1 Tax=Kangiella shandongensis TaxID=2763258 RepID=UPI001CBFA6FB|nr:prephenate dehydratase [Kangiella shandongensis]
MTRDTNTTTDEANQLDNLRHSIGRLDEDLLKIFAERRKLSIAVAANKLTANRKVRDQAQEKNLLTNLTQKGQALGIEPSVTLSLFHNIIEDSVRSQYDYFLENQPPESLEPISLAVLGGPDSYSHLAAQHHFATKKRSFEPLHCPSFMAIFKAIEEGQAELGIVPIENTTSGNITEVYDLLMHHKLSIVGEEKLKVKHCLVATQDASIETLKDVYSHPQAIAQCKDFFTQHPHITGHYRSSSSSALKLVAEYQNPSIGAIASEQAAENSGLKVLRYGINNYQENYTRFLLISKQGITVPSAVPAKTTVTLQTPQKPGALLDCLQVFKSHGINMTKLESRPIPTKPWQELFYIDFEGNSNDLVIEKALMELKQTASEVTILGSYPLHDILATKLDNHALSNEFDSIQR